MKFNETPIEPDHKDIRVKISNNITDYDLVYESFINNVIKEITREIDKDTLHKAFPTEERFEGWIKRVKEIYYNE